MYVSNDCVAVELCVTDTSVVQASTAVLCPPSPTLLPPPASPVTVDRATFAVQWGVLTEHQLEGLEWDGVLAAGGSVLAALQPVSCVSAHAAGGMSNEDAVSKLRDVYHNAVNRASDIDLFFYGMTESQALRKVHCHHIIVLHARHSAWYIVLVYVFGACHASHAFMAVGTCVPGGHSQHAL